MSKDRSGYVLLNTMLGIAIVAALALLFLTGCTTTPTCRDNPRNMQCMTVEQLERELNQ